jgi:hypothetical protein
MSQAPESNNGWPEWSKFVLKELERLSSAYENLPDTLDQRFVRRDLCNLKHDETERSLQSAKEAREKLGRGPGQLYWWALGALAAMNLALIAALLKALLELSGDHS